MCVWFVCYYVLTGHCAYKSPARRACGYRITGTSHTHTHTRSNCERRCGCDHRAPRRKNVAAYYIDTRSGETRIGCVSACAGSMSPSPYTHYMSLYREVLTRHAHTTYAHTTLHSYWQRVPLASSSLRRCSGKKKSGAARSIRILRGKCMLVPPRCRRWRPSAPRAPHALAVHIFRARVGRASRRRRRVLLWKWTSHASTHARSVHIDFYGLLNTSTLEIP